MYALDPSGTRKGLQDWQEEFHSPFVLLPWLSHSQQTTHPSAVAMHSHKPVKHPAAPPRFANLYISSRAGAGVEMPGMCLAPWVSRNSTNVEGLIPPEQRIDPTLTQWSLKSPTITAGAKDLAGFMEQPV